MYLYMQGLCFFNVFILMLYCLLKQNYVLINKCIFDAYILKDLIIQVIFTYYTLNIYKLISYDRHCI